MKKNHIALSPEQTVGDLAHLAWCALVGLRLAQRDGQALSPLTIHTFLLRWLAAAQKQRRFPRSVAPDINSLLRIGRQKGPAAGLQQRLEYLWHSCSSPLAQQSDLFRLTHAIEYLKSQGWVNAVVEDEEWELCVLSAEYAGESALLVRKSELLRNFTDQGQQSAAVEFIVVGDVDVVRGALEERVLCSAARETYPGGGLLVLLSSEEAASGHSAPGKS